MIRKALIFMTMIAATSLFFACDKLSSHNDPSTSTSTCEGCHTDLAVLNSLAQAPVDNGTTVPG
ncbi:MAG TPA: hypothetical protein DHU63_04085 [Candidatus Marinimicrobia bacterium]|nr:MAG: hypothetical protein AUJ47_06510 [Candidatus Marinimicrobia bacterium CG1_02_48_14]HCW75700.1 hypothetical protein [Candidatus Neomarinimicrobiota bacterium]